MSARHEQALDDIRQTIRDWLTSQEPDQDSPTAMLTKIYNMALVESRDEYLASKGYPQW